MDLISVIVPIYKVEKYLRRCIESIIAQTYTNLEIILVDDGSPDRCPSICDEYALKDPRIKVIHQKNGGLSAARNAGLDIATGEYIGFIDSDDYIEPDMYEKLYVSLIENDSDISICDFKPEYEKYNFQFDSTPLIKGVFPGADVAKMMLNCPNCSLTVAWSKLYQKSAFNNIRYPTGKIHEDEFVTFKIIYFCNKVSIINEKLYHYIIRNDGIMGEKGNYVHPDFIEALADRCKFINNYKLDVLEEFWHIFAYNYKEYIKFSKFKKKLSLKDRKKIDSLAKETYKLCKNFATPKEKIIFNILPLYPIIAKLKKSLLKERNLLKYEISQKKADVLLLHSPIYGNFGDQAITLSQIQFLKQCSIHSLTINEDFEDELQNGIYKLISKEKTIVISGGGFMGNLWPVCEQKYIQSTLKNLPDNKIVIFPQTISFELETEGGKAYFDEMKKEYIGHKNLTIFVREKKSFDFMKKNLPEVKTILVPDIVLSLAVPDFKVERDDVIFCLRSDKEKTFEYEYLITEKITKKYPNIQIKRIDNVVDYCIMPEKREEEVYTQIKRFASSKLVVTDRLHGMIFAAITNTPCIAFDNCSGKVSGVYEWISDNEFIRFCRNSEEINQAINTLDIDKEYKFNETEIKKAMKPLYEELYG